MELQQYLGFRREIINRFDQSVEGEQIIYKNDSIKRVNDLQ